MAIIAPHIRAAQAALTEATSQADDLREKLARYNQSNLPAIFVEGATDYRVMNRLLTLFRPRQAAQVFLAEPPQRAGANYVANMLRSWEFRTKHLDLGERRSAVGIVDCDFAGLDAVGRFEAEAIKWKHVSLLQLDTPDHLQAACDLGVSIPVSLEELWPAEVWRRAQEQGWLVQRPRKGLLSESLLARMVDEDLRLSDVVEDDWRIYFENQVNDDPASAAKMDLASYTASLQAAALEPICQAHLAILDRALTKLGIT